MKFFEVFIGKNKIAELAEFTDGMGFLHFIHEDAYPKNEYAKIGSLKRMIIKNSWDCKSYRGGEGE